MKKIVLLAIAMLAVTATPALAWPSASYVSRKVDHQVMPVARLAVQDLVGKLANGQESTCVMNRRRHQYVACNLTVYFQGGLVTWTLRIHSYRGHRESRIHSDLSGVLDEGRAHGRIRVTSYGFVA